MTVATDPATKGFFTYQSDKVPCSLVSTGNVYLNRAVTGSDAEPTGLDPTPVEYDVYDGRDAGLTIDSNGFQLFEHKYSHVDYYDEQQIVTKYYPEVAAFLKEKLGAKKVYVFDHNVRSAATQSWMNKPQGDGPTKELKGSQLKVQSPAGVVHNDFSMHSSKRRLHQLAEPPRVNDPWDVDKTNKPLIDPEELAQLESGRWAMINVWRNIADTPVQDMPLALCDAPTIDMEQLVTFEIRYEDRIGENYFAVPREQNRWYYFPKMVKDEALVLKVWDSEGKHVKNLDDNGVQTSPATDGVEASFSFHSAFSDPAAAPDCPKRESIELRTVVFY
eukprot:GFYU01010850.1.p1 GENE.GFYU01010850.1~~GFYU01010850.1.p1  ORF type:complete len:332 (-),score=90.65 GFYU01010850.1:128-1123(-)